MTQNHKDEPQRILVTGASGFIGGHLCRKLVDQGHRVTGVCRSHPEQLPVGIEAIQADLAQPGETSKLLDHAGPDIIFHLASCVTGSRDRSLVRPTFDANLASTVYLMDAAAGTSCRRFILTGSLEEPENALMPPSSPYAAAKAAATAYARMYHALYEFPVVIARVFMVYGPDQRDEKKLIPYVIESLLQGQPPRMSSGTRMVDWIYVEDVVEGLIRLATAPNSSGQTVDVGTGVLTSVRSVVEQISSLMESTAPLSFDAGADRPMEQVRVAQLEAAERLAGWRPRYNLEEGLRATIAWHRHRHEAKNAK